MVELWKVLVIQFGFGGAMLGAWLLTMLFLLRKHYPWMLRIWARHHAELIAQLSLALKEERESCKDERARRDKAFLTAMVAEREERRVIHHATQTMQERIENALGVLAAEVRGGASG